ncbi:MAG: WYL domain-containing protein [Muribaculaceae bacterium]|nr:WYL domain-containing protein [Muribaculaceae bacterium]
MAQTKNALIRQRVIDRCLRSPKQYSIMDMMEKCNVALENAGYNPVTSKNTILEDLRGIESNFPDAKIIRRKSGRYLYYEYEDKDFSIYNIPLDDDGMAKLAQTISILYKFEGMPNFEWIDEMIDHFKFTLNIPTTKDSVVGFDDNIYLKNRNYFSRLFSAIVAEQTLIITYRPFGKDSIVYNFHPYYLKQYNKRWFLFGCVDGKSNLSNFALDRIEDISNSTVPYIPNTRFDFNDLFKEVVGVSNLFDDVEVINFSVSSYSLDYIQTKPILPNQKPIEKRENETIFEIKTIINRELIQLLLSYGSAITVLRPQKLVDIISIEVSKTLKNYQSVQIN